MEIKAKVNGEKALFELVGKLTVQTAPELDEAVDSLPLSVCDLDIDIAGVDYIASAGFRVLLGKGRQMVRRGGMMRLLHPRDEIMEVIRMTGLSEVFTIES